MRKLLIISGQTATGKTNLGIDLAKKFNGELVSFDSRQAYQYLDIVTGKDFDHDLKTKNSNVQSESKNFKLIKHFKDSVPIWMYDIIDPKEYLSAYEFCQLAEAVIDDVINRGKLPIIVGGTVFYIKTFLGQFDSVGIPPDWELRARLAKLTIEALQQKLQQVDSQRFSKMNQSDRNNKRRLTRAIEVTMSKPKAQTANPKLKPQSHYKTLFLALILDKERLKEKIEERVRKRIEWGALKEVKRLLNKGYTLADPGLNTIGYKQLVDYLKGEAAFETSLIHWIKEEVAYAKRQLVFLKKIPGVHFLHPVNQDLLEKTEILVYKWYNDTKN